MFSLTSRDSKYMGMSKLHKALAGLVRVTFVNGKNPYAYVGQELAFEHVERM